MDLGFYKSDLKKLVATVLLALFSLNILAESGLIKYELEESHPASFLSVDTKVESIDLNNSESSSKQCHDPCHSGACHFGHCAHMVVPAYFAVHTDIVSFFIILRSTKPETPNILGLKRPPRLS